MPDAALTRTGLALLKNDGSDSTTIYRGNIRAIGALLEASGLIGVEGLDSARPAAGTHLRFYKPTDVLGVIYWDNGGTWETIGGSAATDAAAGVGSLRTLGSGPLQALLIPLLQPAGGIFQLSFQTQDGHTETLQSTTNLASPWIDVTNFMGDGSVWQFTFPTTNSVDEYFRVKTQ